MCLSMYIRLYACTSLSKRSVCVCVCVCERVCVFVGVFVCVCECMCLYTHTLMHTRKRVYIYDCVNKH